MSAGVFVQTKYQASYNSSNIHPIRVQPESQDAETVGGSPVENAAPSGNINVPVSATVSRSKRSLGLRPRMITLKHVSGTLPSNQIVGSVTRIPCLTEAFYTAASAKGTQVTYLGATWVVVGSDGEIAK